MRIKYLFLLLPSFAVFSCRPIEPSTMHYKLLLNTDENEIVLDDIRKISCVNNSIDETILFKIYFDFTKLEHSFDEEYYYVDFTFFSTDYFTFYDKTKNEELVPTKEFNYNHYHVISENKEIVADYSDAPEEFKNSLRDGTFTSFEIAKLVSCPGSTSGGDVFLIGSEE